MKDTKTLEECKDKVARENSFYSWGHVDTMVRQLFEGAAQLYASQFQEQLADQDHIILVLEEQIKDKDKEIEVLKAMIREAQEIGGYRF